MSNTDDNVESLLSISYASFSTHSISDPNFKKLDSDELEGDITEQANYEMEEVRESANIKNNIIKILQEQLNILHRKHKETIDETESIKSKYDNVKHELETLKKICAQYKNDLKKYESNRERSSDSTEEPSTDNKAESKLPDAHLQDIAVKIADVTSKVKAVQQIVSDGDLPKNVSDDIDKVNNEYKIRLKKQYNRIEVILTEHSSKLDDIKAKVCECEQKPKDSSKLRFALPNMLISDQPLDENSSNLDKQHDVHLSKINLISTLRQTNDYLTTEVEDLRQQLRLLQKVISAEAIEIVDEVIGAAKVGIESNNLDGNSQQKRTEYKSLNDINNLLRAENHRLNKALQQKEEEDHTMDRKLEELAIIHEKMKAHISMERIMAVERIELQTTKDLVEELKEEIKVLRGSVQQREDTIDELEVEIERLHTKLVELMNEKLIKEQELNDIVGSQLNLSSEKLETLKLQIDIISTQKEDADSLLSKTFREKDTLTRNMTVINNTMQQYKNELEVKQTECVKYKEHIERLEMNLQYLQQEMIEKDFQHEQQMVKHKKAIADMECNSRTSGEEKEQLRDTSQKLIRLKSHNEQLMDEVEQLSMELEQIKGFECKEQFEMNKQMQMLQSFCKTLEKKLENAKAEITYEDAKKGEELSHQLLQEKMAFDAQTSLLKEQIMKQEESSKCLMANVGSYKDVIKGLTKTIQDMKRELDRYRCNSNSNPHRDEDLIGENDMLKEEIRDKACEIVNLRLTLQDYSQGCVVPSINKRSCENVTCPANLVQIPTNEDNVCTMNELRKLRDDITNSQCKVSNMVNCQQEYAFASPNGLRNCYPVQIDLNSRCPAVHHQLLGAAVDKLRGLKGRVETLNQTEEELQILLTDLQQNNTKISKRNHHHGKSDNSKFENQPNDMMEPQVPKLDESVNTEPDPPLQNDPLFNNYQNQLNNAVTKYKQVASPNSRMKSAEATDDNMNYIQDKDPVTIADNNDNVITEHELTPILVHSVNNDQVQTSEKAIYMMYQRHQHSLLIKTDSIDTALSQVLKRKSSKVPLQTKPNGGEEVRRLPKVSIKMFDDNILLQTPSDVEEKNNVEQSPMAIYTADMKFKTFPPLHFNVFYAEVPKMMYARRQKGKLTIYAEYARGTPVISGGPLKCRYKLWQMHFHWHDDDNGSEHTVNDKYFVMEMHAIHIKETASIEEAYNDPDGFVTLTYLYTYSTEDYEDTALCLIIEHFRRFDLRPDDKVLEFTTYFPIELVIQPFDSQYVTYRGSRTDGSDVENVIWIIAPFTNKISLAQMEELREVKSQLATTKFRSLQPANSRRPVYAEALVNSRQLWRDEKNIFLPINSMQN